MKDDADAESAEDEMNYDRELRLKMNLQLRQDKCLAAEDGGDIWQHGRSIQCQTNRAAERGQSNKDGVDQNLLQQHPNDDSLNLESRRKHIQYRKSLCIATRAPGIWQYAWQNIQSNDADIS